MTCCVDVMSVDSATPKLSKLQSSLPHQKAYVPNNNASNLIKDQKGTKLQAHFFR
jgi:hypothetical protein